MTVHRVLLPPGWPRPKGYANGIVARGTTVWTGGVVGWNAAGEFPDNLVDQIRQCLKNTIAILTEADAKAEHIVRMTWYVTSCEAYNKSLPAIGAIWREIIGQNYPAMALVEVTRLVETAALVEIETTAVIPDRTDL
jgi:enamine deaminase RidA (YjgF/YER057c/UK114 family)